MNSVAPSRRPRRRQRLGQLRAAARAAAPRPRCVCTGGRGRSVGSSSSAGAPASCSRQYASCASQHLARQPLAAARPRSRRTAPAAPAAAMAVPAGEGRVERRQLAHQHAHRPAVGDDVVHDQQQHVRPARPAAAAGRGTAARCERSKGRCASSPTRRRAALSRSASGSGGKVHARQVPRRRGLDHAATARPSTRAKRVRSASCRRTISRRLRSSASASSAPVSRSAAGNVVRACSPARAARGTTAAPARTTAAASPSRETGPSGGTASGRTPRRLLHPLASPATVGASNSARSGSSTRNARAPARHHLRRQQRVAAQLEEAVV